MVESNISIFQFGKGWLTSGELNFGGINYFNISIWKGLALTSGDPKVLNIMLKFKVKTQLKIKHFQIACDFKSL